MKVALVCIAKNEDNYIDEWIRYNKKLGFDKIFIYRNDWFYFNSDDKLKIFTVDGLNKQTFVYNQFINDFKNQYDWVAFLDVDEFLVLKKHKNIKDFLSDYSNSFGVGINWYLFGDNGLPDVKENDFSVLNRFTKRQESMNKHIKTILNLRMIPNNTIMYVHNPNVPISSTDGDKILGPFNLNFNDEIAQINHYFCKTFEEFKLKVDRGRADTINKRNLDEFHSHNFNDVEDLSAINFLKN
jgi:hypothetical protein